MSLQYEYILLDDPGVCFEFDYTKPKEIRLNFWMSPYDRMEHKPQPSFSVHCVSPEVAHWVARQLVAKTKKGELS